MRNALNDQDKVKNDSDEERGDLMCRKNADKTEKIDEIEGYYKQCKKTAFCSLVIAVISAIAGMLVIIRLIVISFSMKVSVLQVCLFLFLTLIMLGIAGIAVFLYVFHIRKQKEYVEYMKEKRAFSSCEKIVGEMVKSEDKDKMRTYIIKARMSRFR